MLPNQSLHLRLLMANFSIIPHDRDAIFSFLYCYYLSALAISLMDTPSQLVQCHKASSEYIAPVLDDYCCNNVTIPYLSCATIHLPVPYLLICEALSDITVQVQPVLWIVSLAITMIGAYTDPPKISMNRLDFNAYCSLCPLRLLDSSKALWPLKAHWMPRCIYSHPILLYSSLLPIMKPWRSIGTWSSISEHDVATLSQMRGCSGRPPLVDSSTQVVLWFKAFVLFGTLKR